MQLFFLLLIGFLPLLSLLNPGIAATHDGPDHVARITNFYQSLSEGNLVPRWAGNLNWGYGHPILMFLYPLPSYIASLFHFIGFTFVDSTKLVFVFGFVASILSFYLWASKQWNKTAGLVGALLYGFAPYRFIDLYVRGAIGEHLAFVFPPLIFLGLLKLAKNSKYRWGLLTCLSTTGLLLSHNAISIMFMPIIIAYGIYLYFYQARNKKFLLSAFCFLLSAFLVSSFFLLPAFFEGKYTLRDIVIGGEVAGRFVPFINFLKSSWSYGGSDALSKEVGAVHWIVVIVSVLFLTKVKERKIKIFLVGAFAIFILSLFIMTQWSTFLWQNISLLQKFQFPWRFLSVSVFVTATVGSVVAYLIPKKFALLVSIFILVALLASSQPMWKPKGYLEKPQSYYSGAYPGTTDTGESSPIWSVRFMEKEPAEPMEVIEGKASITPKGRTSTLHSYEIAADSNARLVENTLYFPGWIVSVDGRPIDLRFQDPQYRGLMTFWVEKGTHTIEVIFGQTKLRKFADAVSLLSLAILTLGATIPVWRRRK